MKTKTLLIALVIYTMILIVTQDLFNILLLWVIVGIAYGITIFTCSDKGVTDEK